MQVLSQVLIQGLGTNTSVGNGVSETLIELFLGKRKYELAGANPRSQYRRDSRETRQIQIDSIHVARAEANYRGIAISSPPVHLQGVEFGLRK